MRDPAQLRNPWRYAWRQMRLIMAEKLLMWALHIMPMDSDEADSLARFLLFYNRLYADQAKGSTDD